MITRFLRLFLSTLVLVLISSGIQAGTYHSGDKKKEKKEKLSGDGPYILYQADGSTRVINVNKKGRITDKTYATLPKDFSFRVTDHEGRYPFDVKLHPLKRPESSAASDVYKRQIYPSGKSFCDVRSSWAAGLCD